MTEFNQIEESLEKILGAYKKKVPPTNAFRIVDFWKVQAQNEKGLPFSTAQARFRRFVDKGEFQLWGTYKGCKYYTIGNNENNQ